MEQFALVTHQNCMDGSACATLFIAAGGLRENVFFVSPNHRDVDDLVLNLLENWSGPILIADVSISVSLAKNIKRNDIILLDHHKSAIPLKEFSWCEIDVENTRCGSMMLYDWLSYNMLHPPLKVGDLKELIVLVDDNDRYVKNYQESDVVSLLHEVLGQEFFIDRFLKNKSIILNPMEQYVVDLEIKKRDKYIERKKKEVQVIVKEINERKVNVGFVYANTHQSLLGNKICTDLNMDVAVLIGTNVSLRGSKNCPIDLSVVAKINSGGGHKLASGFSLSSILKNDLVELVKKNIKWE